MAWIISIKTAVVEMIGAEHSPGMEVMTGSLGQGISQGAGIAMARKIKGRQEELFSDVRQGMPIRTVLGGSAGNVLPQATIC